MKVWLVLKDRVFSELVVGYVTAEDVETSMVMTSMSVLASKILMDLLLVGLRN